MAIAFDAASYSAVVAGTDTVSWNHTCAGVNRLLVVGVLLSLEVVIKAVSSITYGGTSLTKIRSDTNSLSKYQVTDLWYLVNPSTGSNSIVVTLDGNLTPTSAMRAGAISLVGVHQTTPDANNGAAAQGHTSVVVTTTKDNCWVVDCAGNFTTVPVVGAGQTQRVNQQNHSTWPSYLAMSTEPQPTAGATTMSWVTNASDYFAVSAASFRPPPAVPAALEMTGKMICKRPV
jgi:hypothetical protein